MFGQGNDQLKEALLHRQSKTTIKNMFQNSNPFFKEQKFDFEYFGMSFAKRILSFIVCLCTGTFLFMYSLYKMIFLALNPTGFVVPYVISNLLFFVMFGFISGFKTYARNLMAKNKRNFTISFIVTTLATLYASFLIRKAWVTVVFGFIQIFSFIFFLLTFLPGGTTGMTSFLGMLMKGLQ